MLIPYSLLLILLILYSLLVQTKADFVKVGSLSDNIKGNPSSRRMRRGMVSKRRRKRRGKRKKLGALFFQLWHSNAFSFFFVMLQASANELIGVTYSDKRAILHEFYTSMVKMFKIRTFGTIF